MIIKSMPRKDASFGQLIAYITDQGKADAQYYYGHNTFSNDPEVALQAIEENAQHLRSRKNGNTMYHEVVSISREEGVDEVWQKKALREIVIEYINKRAGNNLVFGALHDDHSGHLHYHLMISANGVGESKRTRLSKFQFNDIKLAMESFVLEKYPDLKQSIAIGQGDSEGNVVEQELQIQKRGEISKTEKLSQFLKEVLQEVDNEADLSAKLSKYGLEYYRRGNTPGVLDNENGKKYRFKRLGVIEDFESMLAREAGQDSKKKVSRSTAKKQDRATR